MLSFKILIYVFCLICYKSVNISLSLERITSVNVMLWKNSYSRLSMNSLSFLPLLHKTKSKSFLLSLSLLYGEEIKVKREERERERENLVEAPRRLLRINPPRVQVWTPHGYQPVSLKGPRLKHLRGPQKFLYSCAWACVCLFVCEAYIADQHNKIQNNKATTTL